MRITGVESTDLFTGSASRPLQVIRVTAEGEPGDHAQPSSLRIEGPGVSTPGPFGIIRTEPGETDTVEVGVAVSGQFAAGSTRAVTVIAETDGGRAEHQARITVAEPGWTMWMVSHFHYDPVWWNTQGQFTEARLVLPDEDGKLPDARTAFDLVRLHLEKARRDPDYKFVLAEVDYLKPHFDAFPADREQVAGLLAAGRLELVGGTYNEPNTNLTGAETTIRNAVYGVGFQRGVLGGDPRSAWMLDGFGHDPGFPGLMAAAGLTSSSWARGPFHQWGPADNGRMQFPAEFEWLSPDGTGLLTAYMANHYGVGWRLHTAGDLATAEKEAYEQFRSLAAVAATRNVMLPVGADHTIPARWVTDVHRSWNARYVWPRFVSAIPRDFFDAVRAEAAGSGAAGSGAGASSGVWITPQTRDMNTVYTGKDVSYTDTKQAHRAGETALSEGERLAALAWLNGAAYPAESLDKAWRLLAFGAHHDAITGTESDQVYLDLLAGWREAAERGKAARGEAAAFLAGSGSGSGSGGEAGTGRVTVFNGLARERSGMATVTVRVDEPGTPWLAVVDEDPATLPADVLPADVRAAEVPSLAEGVRRHPDGSLAEVTLTFRATAVPALGYRSYALRPVPAPPATDHGWRDIAGTTIENDAFTITADPARGGTLAITGKRSGRQFLSGPGNELVLQEEYDKHPRWGEGAWHLSPKGPGAGSASADARVRAQRCAAGSRLVATFGLGDLRITAETLLWDGAERVEFRTHVDGSIGKDRLLRVRFPASVPGGLPVYQTATAVIGRPFGTTEADVAEHWWTLDNPAHHWFGLGSVARVELVRPGRPSAVVQVAAGVAEVITPNILRNGQGSLIRSLLVSLAGAGVTATCSRATGPRYGSVDMDSNLPDFRIALGGPQDNSFTAEVLAASDPSVAKRLAELVADGGTARLWVPASRTRAEAFAPSADLRGPRDLPVLIVAPAEALLTRGDEPPGTSRDAPDGSVSRGTPPDPQASGPGAHGELAAAIGSLRADLLAGQVIGSAELAPDAPGDDDAAWPPDLLGEGTVALFNRGTPGGVVTPDGTLWMSLMRANSSWPCGIWIDGDQRTVPDGSSFAWQHWSHTFRYALACADGGWREAGLPADAEDYNHDLIAVASSSSLSAPGSPSAPAASSPSASLSPSSSASPSTSPASSPSPSAPSDISEMSDIAHVPPGVSLLAVGPANVTLSALKPRGNPLAAGRPGTPPSGGDLTVRLRETDGTPTVASVALAAGIESAWLTDLLEETDGMPVPVEEGKALVDLGSFATATVIVRPARRPSPGAEPTALAAGAPTPRAVAPSAAPEHALAAGTPEPVQPVYTRYWLHGKGPAPAGNLPVAVHFTPSRLTLRPPAVDESAVSRADDNDTAASHDTGRLRLTVACGPEPASGEAELIVPEGIAVEAGETALAYSLDGGGFVSWDVTVRAAPDTPDGRYFIATRIRDDLGQILEDAALVTVGEPGGPDPDLPPEELFVRMQTDVMALAGEADLEILTPGLTLAPGEAGEFRIRVANNLATELRGEVQLLSPFGTWDAVTPWTREVSAAPADAATLAFPVTIPATAEPGQEWWLLAKLMYFGRVRYSEAVRLTVTQRPES